MERFRARGALACAALIALVAAPRPARADAPGPSLARAHVTYVSGGSVYVDAGETEGLRERDSLAVVRGDSTVAWLSVTYLSIHRAACDTLSTRSPVRPGDLVLYFSHGAPPPIRGPATPAPGSAASAAPAPPAAVRARGRLGLNWLSMSAGGTDLSLPSLDARLDATTLQGALSLTGDFRGRRGTTRFAGSPDIHDDRDIVYRLALSVRPADGRYRVTLGRMLAPTLAAAGMFDGLLAELPGRHWGGGVFAGAQPDPVTFGPSGDVLQEGAYVRWQTDPAAARRTRLQLGAASSTDHGQANRDFAFLAGNWLSPGTTAFFTQEADFNRGWKRTLGQEAVVFSGTNAGFTHRFHEAIPRLGLPADFDLYGGFDSRRNVWLYRDHATPETQFDDRLREGGWLGGAFERFGHLRVSGEFRGNGVAWAQAQLGWSAAVQGYGLGRGGLGLAARMTQLGSRDLANTLLSLTASASPLSALQLDLTGGTRSSKDRVAAVSESSSWLGTDLDLALPARAYLSCSYQQDRGGAVPIRQLTASLGLGF